MGNESKKLSQRERELENDKAGQSGAQAGNPAMKQKEGAKGDGTPNASDVAANEDPKTDETAGHE